VPNPQVHVHYFVDSVNGLAKIHFSGSRFEHGKFIKNKSLFGLALIGMQTIPSKDKVWNDASKTWNVHFDVWANLMPYYTTAPEIYEMISYATRAQWTAFVSGKVAVSNGTPANDAEAAAQFFGTAAFNNAVVATASITSEREELVSLLGLANWGSFDALHNGELRKVYRAAAMRLHPDRNAGDGSRMAKLNQLMGIYGGVK
jgi:hypothetical protein